MRIAACNEWVDLSSDSDFVFLTGDLGFMALVLLPLVVLIQVGALIVFRVYRVPWLFTSTRDIFVITTSVFCGAAVIGLMLYLFRVPLISRSAFILHAVLLIGLLMTSRLLYRAYQTRKK